jgi:O-antigen biosynthesis protein WbqP
MINITQSLLTKRYFDLLLVMIVVILLIIPVFLVAIVVRLTSKGPVLYIHALTFYNFHCW